MFRLNTTCKRKFDSELDRSAKHQRCNGTEPEILDVDMCSEPTPATSPTTSSPVSSASQSPVAYPQFELYPDINLMDCSPDSSTPTTPIDSTEIDVGLFQPKLSTSFQHHGNCSQIPKLRIANSPGLNGSRSLWSHCMQCGALEMVQC